MTKTRRYFPIKTYHSLKEHLLNIKQEKNELFIFGTNGLSIKVNKKTGFNTLSLRDAQRLIFGDFSTAKFNIHFQSLLRKEILNKDYKHKTYLLNRLSSIVESYYIFAELGKRQINYDFKDSQKNEVMHLINFLLKRTETKEYLDQKSNLTKKMISRRLVDHDHLDKLMFYEIEYMNFGRMSFIYWLREKGFQIEFHVPYEKRLKNVHRYWESVYSTITNGSLDEVAEDSISDKPGIKFGYFYENEKISSKDQIELKIMEFETPYDFSQYIKLKPESLIAIESEKVRTLIENYKSKVYENDVGKFFYHIQFCSFENGEIYGTYEIFTELMTSDFVKTKSVKGKDALSLLIDLQEYMSGIKTVNDLKKRLKPLMELEYVSRSMDKENSEDAGKNRMKRYMLNPFRAFSFLNQTRYEITIHQLFELVVVMENVLKSFLIEENGTKNVNEYFNRCKTFIDHKIQDSEEKEFWSNIFENKYPDDWEFSIREMLDLIYLEVSSLTDDTKKVRNINSIQEIIFEENTHSLHVTNITQMNFPEKLHTKISDFFDYTEFKKCIKAQDFKPDKYLYFLWVDFMVSRSIEQLGIYRLYQIISQFDGSITLSWIKNLEKSGLRNIHLDILSDLYCDGKIETYKAPIEEWKPGISNNVEKKAFAEEVIKGKIPDLYWLDHDFCSKKFFLTTFIEQQPIYENDFHHQLLFSRIGKLMSYSRASRMEFKKNIYPLFPHWTETKKDNLIDTEYKTELRQYKTFENISYPKAMNRLQILRSVYRENRRTKARNRYNKYQPFNDKELIKQFKDNIKTFHVVAEPGNHCKMCPHLNSCIEGMYAVDNLD